MSLNTELDNLEELNEEQLNDLFRKAQDALKSKSNEELMENIKPYKYEYLLDNLSSEKKKKLDKIIQAINANISLNSNETDSLDALRGISINDLDDAITIYAENMAQTYVDEGGLDGLRWLASNYQDTPAYNVILKKYSDDYRFSRSMVQSAIKPYVDDRISPQDFLTLISYLDPQYIEKHENDLRSIRHDQYEKIVKAAEEEDFYAQKFMEAYSHLCEIIVRQYANEHHVYGGRAMELPKCKKKCEQLWSDMLKDKEAYISDSPLVFRHEENSLYLSEEKVAQAKTAFADIEKASNPIQRAIGQIIARRKIFAAIHDDKKERQGYTNAPFFKEMFSTGITTYTQARRVIDLYWALNERPDRYNSSYNEYSVSAISRVVQRFNLSEQAEWMYPVLLKAANEGHLNLLSNRQPSEHTLFDACRTWKVCPKMPLRLAKKIGQYSIEGRIIAGAVFEKLSKEKELTPVDWLSDKELQAEFYSTLSQYLKMDRIEALNDLTQYIGKGNRKRLLYNALEKAGLSVDNERFKPLLEKYKTKENIGDLIEYGLTTARKGRFASDDEFAYALEHFDKKTLAESMIFRAQQRVMNILVSASAQESGMDKAVAESFRRPDAPAEIKDYVRNNNDWLIPASFKGAAIFKEYFPAYIRTVQNHNKKNPQDKLSIHDALYWLPEPMGEEANLRFAQFIQRNIIYQNAEYKDVHRPLSELKIIAQNWKSLENKLQKQGEIFDVTKLKYNDVLSICMSVKYRDQRNDAFAVEAAKHGVSESQYHNCEDIYLAGLKVPEPFDSHKRFTEGKYTGRFLPRDDPRTLFFGDYTDCCQHYGGAGHACAVSTVKHPFSQLFVIEDDKGKIIAGSWTWENTEGKYREVCFDNIESLGDLSRRPELNKIYEQVGEYLTKEQNCHRVTIGLGYQDADVSGYASTEAIPLPQLYGKDSTGSYSDARSQVLLSENPNAKPLDKTNESQRYIRDVCFLDLEAMDRVSYAVFPDSDKQLQAPDNLAGFVIEDREKGVVGYCLYDKGEKSIYDMAVLPEYRTDKNASSRKLFAEMMRTISKEGGQWSAEMRDETTLRYLKLMAERGLVKYEEHGIDHTMSDGSKVVAVTFTLISDDVRRATRRVHEKLGKNQETEPSTTPIKASASRTTKNHIADNERDF